MVKLLLKCVKCHSYTFDLIKEEEENIDNLDNKEFENKIKELESGLNKKDKNNDKKYVLLITMLFSNFALMNGI